MALALSQQARIELARIITDLLDHWRITPADQVALLGMPPGTRPRVLARYRKGTPFPDDQACVLRAEYLLSIQASLQTTFPMNRRMDGFWLTSPNRRLDNLSPLALMLRDGLEGMEAVRTHLDCTRGWI